MTDVEQTHSSAPDELVDLTKVRTMVREFRNNGQPDHALSLLDQLARWPDSTRYLDDNLWLYRQLGDLYREDAEDEALTAYQRGFQLDPRDLGILKPYSELLFATDQVQAGVRVVQSMILHHKRDLGTTELAEIYERLGGLHEKAGDFVKSRTAFEKALEQGPDRRESLEGLLRVVGAVADPIDVIRVRQKLIRSLKDSESRSLALVALGDDWINEFNDPGRALDVFEQAVAEWTENKDALSKIAKVGSEIGDWRRVGRAYFTLSQLAETDEEKADWIFRSSEVARDHLWEADKALTGFRKALELDPKRIDVFKALSSILVDAKDYDELETAYVQFISANMELEKGNPRLLAVLWRKLGDLYHGHLNRVDDAVFAYQQCSEFTPDDESIHTTIVEITESNADHLDKAVDHLRHLWRIQNDVELLDRMGRVYLRQKSFDRALCVFRALTILDRKLDANAQGFVDKFDTAMFRPIQKQFSSTLMRRSVFHEDLDVHLNDVFSLLKRGLDEWTGEGRSKYGLKRGDRVKLEEPLAFNNTYKSIGGTLGYTKLPELWHKQEQIGLINGALIPEGMIAGDALLGSGREEFIAFVIAKQLFLFLNYFYLAAIRAPSDLQVFYGLGASHVLPNVKIEMNKDRESALKAIRKRIKGDDLEKLKAAYQRTGGDPDIANWVERIEDTANRVGLIFADDMKACKEYLEIDPQPVGDRPNHDRMIELINYSISEKFFDLRETLGIAVA